MRIAVYPGSFDPPTLGHVDVIERAAKLFDRLIIGIGENSLKNPLFSCEERVAMVRECSSHLQNVSVEVFSGLLMDFATASGAMAVVRGLRAVSDFENEFQMALVNRTLQPAVETVFLMTSPDHMFVSSSIVKEVAGLGGTVDALVPPPVAEKLRKAFSR